MSLELNDVLFDVKTNKPVKIDLTEIIKSRALFQANSGGGKSYILRKFLEQSHGKVQQIIIDPEGEFATLREKYDYLLVSKGEGANIQLNINHAGLLARRLLETGANAILDLYELNPFERIAYVKAFCDALINLPKNLWHSCLIVIDEIHTFAPENSKGNAGSLDAVAALASRGRKRGYALIGATQKLSKFHKDVAAELNTKFTGRCILDIDQKRAAAELGLQDYKSLRNLKYEFWSFGPAISGEPILVKSYEVETKHEDIGNTRIKTIADQDKLNKLMEQFKDLPTEAANELKTKEDLQNKIKELTVRLQKAERQPSLAVSSSPKIDPAALQQAEQRGYQRGIQHATTQFNKFEASLKLYIRTFKPIIQRAANMGAELAKLQEIIPDIEQTIQTKLDLKLPALPIETKLPTAPKVSTNSASPVINAGQLLKLDSNSNDQALSGPEEKILKGLLSLPNQRGTKIQVAFAGGYTNAQGGGFRNPTGSLRTKGFLEYEGELIVATDAAKAMFPDVEPMPLDSDSIQNFWLNLLPGPEQKILKPVMEAYPNSISRIDTAAAAGYTNIQAGGFRNPVGHLRSLGLIDYVGKDNDLIASKELFPE